MRSKRTLIDKEYQRLYYNRNKDKLQREKKRRYENDSSYKEGLVHKAKLAYALRALEKNAQIKPQVRSINKREETVMLLSEVANFVGRHSTVLYRWRNRKYLPAPLFLDIKKRGLYTYSQAQYIKSLLASVDENKCLLTYNDLNSFLTSIWTEEFEKNKLKGAIREESNS